MKCFLLLGCCLSAVPFAGAAVIISENFGGAASAALNGTSADVFDSAIVTAGGSATWTSASGTNTTDNRGYAADGTVRFTGGSTSTSAYLNLGSYITVAKGTDYGKFTLQATFTPPTGTVTTNWVSLGFFSDDRATNRYFAQATAFGYATSLLRGSDAGNDYYGGVGTGNGNGTGISVTGTTTFTTVLDFTPAGGYDGVANFGTVSFYRNGGATPEFTYTYTADPAITGVGFSGFNSPNLTISNFSLSQVPEPSGALMLLGSAGVLLRRRRK